MVKCEPSCLTNEASTLLSFVCEYTLRWHPELFCESCPRSGRRLPDLRQGPPGIGQTNQGPAEAK